MAHIAKFKRHSAGQIGAHVDRLRGDGRSYGNVSIDTGRTHLNYDLSGCRAPFVQMVDDAVRAAPKTVRKDAVMLCAYCVTLPRDWPEGRDPRDFFEAVRDFDLRFVSDTWREVRATVHMDETRPHLHHVFVPLDGHGQPNFNGTYRRAHYKRYHDELQRSVRDTLGIETLHVLLDDDDVAGKALSALPQADYVRARRAEGQAQERLERLRREEGELAAEVGVIEEELEALDAKDGERRRYVDSHQADGGREEELARELGELRELGRRAEERVGQLERGVAEARQANRDKRGRLGALDRLVSEVRERAAALRRLVAAVVGKAGSRARRLPQLVARRERDRLAAITAARVEMAAWEARRSDGRRQDARRRGI